MTEVLLEVCKRLGRLPSEILDEDIGLVMSLAER